MSQASQTSNAKKSYVCRCGNLAMLRTSHTDMNSGRQFFNCAIGAYIKFSRRYQISNIRKALNLFKEAEEQRDHFKGLLKDTEKDRDQLKQKLILDEEKEKGLKIMLYGLLLVVVFWKCVTGMQ
ncbi:hypothetical protein R3W88_023921 [Solanum pinnatisectum]|uniref:GRF-type domain-containing protein n=1 Tax=Solanum pinnatisectum TaxID=50273 RepID=A0AAV9LZR5_9SOLN|nr:hypothetical protein R3W88_023921 [Solanum pinnatisectum]